MNILLGDISSYKAICVARFLKENYPHVKIYGFDTRNFTNRWRTKYVDKNFILDNTEITSFVKIIKKFQIDLFLPVINESLEYFWRNKKEFLGTLDYLGDYESYQILNDKIKLANLANKLEIPIPVRYDSLKTAKCPFVFKPTNLSSSKGVVYVKFESDIPKEVKEENLIIQQYVEGEGVGYSFYAKNGVVISGYGHKRLAEFPVSGGSSTYRTGYSDNRMKKYAERIIASLNYTGFAMFEYKLTPENKIYLLEVNPRIWGSINQGMQNGINYFESLLGELRAPNLPKKKSYNTYLSPLVYISLIAYLMRLNLIPIKIFAFNIFSNKSDVDIIKDFKGFMSIVLRKILK